MSISELIKSIETNLDDYILKSNMSPSDLHDLKVDVFQSVCTLYDTVEHKKRG